jgi:hypothetical protein
MLSKKKRIQKSLTNRDQCPTVGDCLVVNQPPKEFPVSLKSLSQLGTVGATASPVAMLTALGFETRCSEWPGSQEPKPHVGLRRDRNQACLIPTL